MKSQVNWLILALFLSGLCRCYPSQAVPLLTEPLANHGIDIATPPNHNDPKHEKENFYQKSSRDISKTLDIFYLAPKLTIISNSSSVARDPRLVTPSTLGKTDKQSIPQYPANTLVRHCTPFQKPVMNFSDASSVLDLNNIRASLVRMEETIVFGLIERSQFFLLPSVYQPNKYPIAGFDGSFMEWLLLQTEKTHSQLRRYQAPDETPFFPNELLQPILPSVDYAKVLASYSDEINVNGDILDFYVNKIVPQVACEAGDQNENSGSVSVCDVECLQSLSRRIHFGKFVAEAKFKGDPELYKRLILARDVKGIEASITNQAVEDKILLRLKEKCEAYGTDPSLKYSHKKQLKVDPEIIVLLYKQYVIPLTKKVEVEYLLRRLEDEE